MLKPFVTLLFLTFPINILAADASQIQGAWKLISYEVEAQDTGQIFNPMGKNPSGYVVFTPEQRVSFVLTAEGRKPAKTVEDKARLLQTLIAYTGTYRIEDNTFITSVEVAWNPTWIGTEQAREFQVEGNTLRVLTPWRKMPNWPDSMTRSIVTFQKAQ